MNVKNNQRVRLTKTLLKKAYVDLMQNIPVGKITVRALCEKAELNRTTFYLHYGEPNDVLIEIENEIVQDLIQCLDHIDVDEAKNLEVVTGPLLEYVRDHDRMFRVMMIDNADLHFRNKVIAVVIERVCQVISVRLDPAVETMIYDYVVQGCLAALTNWICSGYRLPQDEMNRLLVALSAAGIEAGQKLMAPI